MMKNGVKIFIRLKCIDIGGGDDDYTRPKPVGTALVKS